MAREKGFNNIIYKLKLRPCDNGRALHGRSCGSIATAQGVSDPQAMFNHNQPRCCCSWMFKVKTNAGGFVAWFTAARLVAGGHHHQAGVHVYTPVSRHATLCAFIVAHMHAVHMSNASCSFGGGSQARLPRLWRWQWQSVMLRLSVWTASKPPRAGLKLCQSV